MPDLDWLYNQPPLLLLQLGRTPAHWLQRFGEAGRAVQRWRLADERLVVFRRELPLAWLDPLAVLERSVAEQAPGEAPAERDTGPSRAWPAHEPDPAPGARARGPRTRLLPAASRSRDTSFQDFAHERGPGRSDARPSARRGSPPAAIGDPPAPAASRATGPSLTPNGERPPLPPAAPRLPTTRLAALAGGLAAWQPVGERRVTGPAAPVGQGVPRPAPGGGGPAVTRERPPVLAERQSPLAGHAALLSPEAQARARATPVGGPGLAPEHLVRALLTGSVGKQRGAAPQGEPSSVAAPGRGPARAGERGGAEQPPRGEAGTDQRLQAVPSAGYATAHVLPSMVLLQTLLARYEAGGGAPAERQYPRRNGWPPGRAAGQPVAAAAEGQPRASGEQQADSGAQEAGAHSPELAPATAAHALSPGLAAGPAVQNTFNVTVHTAHSADEPDDELAERITRILVEQARRHGIDV